MWKWLERIIFWGGDVDPEPEFTGNCLVRMTTGDGDSVGRCWHSTYGGRCPTHGDVTEWLVEDPLGASYGNSNHQMRTVNYNAWPRDDELTDGP